jgi:hypothetical protein
MSEQEKQWLERLERLVYGTTPADLPATKCRAFAKRTAKAMLTLMKEELARFIEENPEK